MSDSSIIIEFISQGAYVKVTAIDSRTGAEATIVGAASAGKALLEKRAIQKLRYVMNKEDGE